MHITVIVSTYNWPQALECVLRSFMVQSAADFEVVVADDGSDSATLSMINALRPALSYPLQHVWQEDSGFRLAAIRNKAIVAARGDYIVFIDQDWRGSSGFYKKPPALC